MKPIVMKFGGTSVGSPKAMTRSARLVVREAARVPVVVVVSALNGVTNQLLSLVERAAYGGWNETEALVRELDWRHRSLITSLGLNPAEEKDLLKELDHLLNHLRLVLLDARGGALTSPFELSFYKFQDSVASLGEKLSAPIFAALLRRLGTASLQVDASRIIFTDGRFSQANVLFDLTNPAVQCELNPLLAQGIAPVVTGFIGATLDGAVTTLGRGASDYTATILGAALSAAEIWNWTDVDGVFSADPRLAPRARLIRELSYAEMALLSACGARVLHPDTVRPVASLGIPLRVRNSFRPDQPGTLVQKEQPVRDQRPFAVVSQDGYEFISYQTGLAGNAPRGAELYPGWIDGSGCPARIVKKDPQNNGQGVSLLTILGGTGSSQPVARALEKLPVPILAWSPARKDGCLQAAVWEADAPDAVRLLHDRLVVSDQ